MRILFITNMFPVPDYQYFGIHVQEQILALERDQKVEVDVYFINGRENKLNYWKSISEIKNKLAKEKFDLIHIHYGISGLFLLFLKPDIPVVVTLHSGELFQKKGYFNHLAQKNLTMEVIKRADKVIVLNDDMIKLLGSASKKLIKLPCGTNTEVFKGELEPQNKRGLTVGFPGNKERKEKNYPLFEAILESLKEFYTIEVVEFHNLTRQEVVNTLLGLDLLLMTSKVEGSPQIIKEAMACNRPIVSSNVGDVADLLKNVTHCYVVDSFSKEAFINPVRKILDLPSDQRYSTGREKLIEMGLDSQSVSEKLYTIYKQVI